MELDTFFFIYSDASKDGCVRAAEDSTTINAVVYQSKLEI
jgi:hypothetical protein